ncbi:MAG: tRNA lysidine(34) synthetase TilS, partial [Pseudobdellovibrionaceae bacterium]
MSLRKQKQFSQQQNKKTWSKTHHELFQKVSGQGLLRKKVLLMVSGGADSMAALRLWSEVFPERSKFAVFHFHHGSGPQVKFRNQAASFLKKICAAHEIDFFLSENILQDLKTEAAFRKSRYLAARKIMAEHGFEFLVTAHHANDLLETRLIRLIRGTSGEGLIAIPELKKDLFRPWLQTSQKKLRQVLLSSPRWSFIEDPTNSDSRANLRNWIRQEWLAQLETIRPGGSFRLAASLESLLS